MATNFLSKFFNKVNNYNTNGENVSSHDLNAAAAALSSSNDNDFSILKSFKMPPGCNKNRRQQQQQQQFYGVYELNTQFDYVTSPDFDQTLANKHDIPMFDLMNNDVKYDSLINTAPPTSAAAATAAAALAGSSSVIDRQPLLKRLMNVFNETGFVGVCEEIASMKSSTNGRYAQMLTEVAAYLVRFTDFVHAPINPWLLYNRQKDYEFASLKSEAWKLSAIKSFQWHPKINKYAIVLSNDIVKVYSCKNVPTILKHQKQINVTCISWKPFHSSILAVGCADKIIIWDSESLPISIKPASSCSFILSKPYHKDIVDLQWYPNTDFLLSLASKDNQIMIWDTAMKECVPVKRVGTSGFMLARFSPNGNKLFTADLSTTFRVWNPINYWSEQWTNLVSRCNAACWSPDGSILLFSCNECSLLYALKFLNNKQQIQIVCDLASVLLSENIDNEMLKYETIANNGDFPIPDSSETIKIGGAINEICWDPSGQRVAVSFKKYNDQLNVIATFIVKIQPQFQLLPCGLVYDQMNSWPASISFKPEFNAGALLSIAWSSARIQHVPFYFDKLSEETSAAATGFHRDNVSNISYYS